MPAIIFDLDDTLYPEHSYVLSGFRAVSQWCCAQFGFPADDVLADLVRLSQDGNRGRVFDRWLEDHAVPVSSAARDMVAAYREHQPEIAPFPGVPELLARLRRRYRLGVVSDGYLAVQRKKLAALGLERLFDAVVFSDEMGRESWKPSTAPFELILQRLDTPGCEAAYVADNPLKDFLGARQSGMKTVHLMSPGGVYAGEVAPGSHYEADVRICSLAQLEQVVSSFWPQHAPGVWN